MWYGKLNCIKVVLVEKQRKGKWLAEQLGSSICVLVKWCSNTILIGYDCVRENRVIISR